MLPRRLDLEEPFALIRGMLSVENINRFCWGNANSVFWRNSHALDFIANCLWDRHFREIQAHALALPLFCTPGPVLKWSAMLPSPIFASPSRMLKRALEARGQAVCRADLERLSALPITLIKSISRYKYQFSSWHTFPCRFYGVISMGPKPTIPGTLQAF